RTNGFEGAPPESLPAAKNCFVRKISSPADSVSKFVCYWQEANPSAAEARFRDLVARLQVLVPSDWSAQQENEVDEQTDPPIVPWHADDPASKHTIRLYLSANSVALHIATTR